jgi:hypothetical protein
MPQPSLTMDGQIYSGKDFAELSRARARERMELLSKLRSEFGGA